MNVAQSLTFGLALLAAGCAYDPSRSGVLTQSHSSAAADDFTSLFDGQSLAGWTFVGRAAEGYHVRNGAIVAEKGVHGNLFTEKEYGDFVLRLEFLLAEPGANNGVGIRAPLASDTSTSGIELQVLEESGAEKKYGKLRPEQFHGSVYDCIAARRGALKPIGQWNTQEVVAQGRHIKVTVNHQVIVDADLNSVTDIQKLQKHPGLLRERGHIGFLGHDDHVEFRNIRIRELPAAPTRDNVPPAGFQALFDGHDLTGWKGQVADLVKRTRMSAPELAAAQTQADEIMRRDWRVENGTLTYRGKGYENLCTVGDHANYELFVDWLATPLADSGLYLRGTPQVQIWDVNAKGNPKKEGSGGLYNNTNTPTGPLLLADHPAGQWNRFRILMLGEQATVFLNGEMVVRSLPLENYWDHSKPLASTGPIELQAHDSVVSFKNIYLRPLP